MSLKSMLPPLLRRAYSSMSEISSSLSRSPKFSNTTLRSSSGIFCFLLRTSRLWASPYELSCSPSSSSRSSDIVWSPLHGTTRTWRACRFLARMPNPKELSLRFEAPDEYIFYSLNDTPMCCETGLNTPPSSVFVVGVH